METIEFFFSFRSPYSWLAYYRIARSLGELAVRFERIPVFPPPNFLNDPAANPNKLDYLFEDVQRIAAAYGLPVNWPQEIDADWMRPHAAYLKAQDLGRGDEFALALYAKRFSEGKDAGSDEIMKEAAREAGLDPEAIVSAADDGAFHARVMNGMRRALEVRIFGVPFFIYRGKRFWGNDRLEWLLREIDSDTGRAVPDLRKDLFARVF